jgi:hypothetical protein
MIWFPLTIAVLGFFALLAIIIWHIVEDY